MPIYGLLQESPFGPDAVQQLASVFDEVCRELDLADRTDPLRDAVARKVIEIAQTGVLDPDSLRSEVLRAIRGA